MDFETIVQIIVAAQALTRLTLTVEQHRQRKPAEPVERSTALTRIVRTTSDKEVCDEPRHALALP